MNDLGLVLKNIDNVEILLDEDLSKYSTLKLIAQGDVIIIKSKNALEYRTCCNQQPSIQPIRGHDYQN